MKTLLHIASSARRTDNQNKEYNSISKTLSSYFIDQWVKKNNEDKIISRDIGLTPPEYISQDWIAAAFTHEGNRSVQQKQLLALSDTLINEVILADIIIISTPMYNYGMPAALKSWFDHVVRINETFTFDLARGDFPIEPILSGKMLVLISSSGEFGFEQGGIREQMNHLTPHIKTASNYLGVDAFYEIKAEYQEFSDARHEQSIEEAYCSINELIASI